MVRVTYKQRAHSSVQIAEHIVRLVAFLKRDEAPETMKDGEDDVDVSPASDDEDNQIMEI